MYACIYAYNNEKRGQRFEESEEVFDGRKGREEMLQLNYNLKN